MEEYLSYGGLLPTGLITAISTGIIIWLIKVFINGIVRTKVFAFLGILLVILIAWGAIDPKEFLPQILAFWNWAMTQFQLAVDSLSNYLAELFKMIKF